MAKQIIFDNETFFEGYRKLREREVNSNNLFEIPTLYALFPDHEDDKSDFLRSICCVCQKTLL